MTRPLAFDRLAPLSLALLGALVVAPGCSTYALGENGEGATGDSDGSDGSSSAGSATGAASSGGDSGGGTGGYDSAGDSGGDPTAGGTSGETGADTDTTGGEPLDPGQLTAGEWRDLDHWSFWTDLLAKPEWANFQTLWKLFTLQRYAVVVEAGEGGHVADAEVVLLGADQSPIWQARTDVRGRAELFAAAFGEDHQGPFTIHVQAGAAEASLADAQPFAGDPAILKLDAAPAPSPILDLMFMIDTTGSMSDELSYLQAEVADVIGDVQAQVGQSVTIRLSVNFYRDDGDEYLVRAFPFTEDIAGAVADLSDQSADGGGDFPEAVGPALDAAIFDHQWSDSAVSRLCFLVLDAPPHDDADTVGSMQVSLEAAAQKGIRVIPVAASGVDKSTEFFLRMADILTGGTYVFLTSHSGIGGDHLEPTIGDYQVELLNALLTRLIVQSLQDA